MRRRPDTTALKLYVHTEYCGGSPRYRCGVARPKLITMLLRGAVRRCAWCGGRNAFFTGWAKKAQHCQTCGLGWRRDDVGYELGAAAMAAIICMGPLILLLAGIVAVTWPEVHVVPLFIVLGTGGILLPIILYPSSYLMWQGVDILMRPVLPDHFANGVPTPSKSASNASTAPKR